MSKEYKPIPGHQLTVDDTAAYLKNPFAYLQDNFDQFGRIFQTRFKLLEDVIVMSGPDAGARFNDAALVQREGAFPASVISLFGGASLPFQDGKQHGQQKELVLSAFTMDALELYLPEMQHVIEHSLQEWSTLGEFKMAGRLKDLAFEVISANMLGLMRGDQLKLLQSQYDSIAAGLVALPIKSTKTTLYDSAALATKLILEKLRFLAEIRRTTPFLDGLSRILCAETSGRAKLTVDQAALEIHYAILAGYVVFGELVALMRYLSSEPAVTERLKEELKGCSPEGDLSLQMLGRLRYLGQFVMEVKRLCPVIPAQFGRARRDFELYDYMIPEGRMLLWAIKTSNADSEVYTNPREFDPDRFSPERAEDLRREFGYVPQGGGPASGHRCPGLDYASQMMAVFTVALLRHYDWKIKDPGGDYNWTLNPPEPVDGLLARLMRS